MNNNGNRQPEKKGVWALVICGDAAEFKKTKIVRTVLLEMPPDEFEAMLTKVKSAPDGETIVISVVKQGNY